AWLPRLPRTCSLAISNWWNSTSTLRWWNEMTCLNAVTFFWSLVCSTFTFSAGRVALVFAILVPTVAAPIIALNTNDFITIQFCFFLLVFICFLCIRRQRGKNVALPRSVNRQIAHNCRPMESRLDESALLVDKSLGKRG